MERLNLLNEEEQIVAEEQEMPLLADELALDLYARLRAEEKAADAATFARVCAEIASDPRLAGP